MAITLRDIASRAQVHETTVSKVLNGKHRQGRISPECVQRVQRVARQMGYRVNVAARATVSGKFNNIVLLQGAGYWSSNLPGAVLGGLHDALAERGLHLTLAKISDDKLTDARYVPRILQQWMCDGLLINYHAAIPPRLIELVHACALPNVWLNCKLEDDCVHPDDADAGRRATRHLLALGHRRIAYLDFGYRAAEAAGTLHYSKLDRMAGYEQAMGAAGLTPRIITDAQAPEGERLRFFQSLLGDPDRPTALITYADDMAQLARLAAARLGLCSPTDLSLITFGGPDYSTPELRVGRMQVPEGEVARAAVAMLMEKLRDPARSLERRAVPFNEDFGYTVAPPPRDT